MGCKICRSYSKTIQISQFEPIKSFSSIEVEIDDDSTEFAIKQESKRIYKLCKEVVESDIAKEVEES